MTDAVEPKDWGHLRILQRLGSGSYGVVYRAFETRLQCDVALKLAKPTRARELDEPRALKEARMLARVRHANVVSASTALILMTGNSACGWSSWTAGRSSRQW